MSGLNGLEFDGAADSKRKPQISRRPNYLKSDSSGAKPNSSNPPNVGPFKAPL